MRTGFIVKLVLAMLLLVALMPKSCAASLADWAPISVKLGMAQVMLPHRHAQFVLQSSSLLPSTNVYLRWRGSDLSASPVASWVDEIQGQVWAQSTNANQPTWSSNKVIFNGTNQRLDATNNLAMHVTGGSNWAWLVVSKWNTITGNRMLMGSAVAVDKIAIANVNANFLYEASNANAVKLWRSNLFDFISCMTTNSTNPSRTYTNGVEAYASPGFNPTDIIASVGSGTNSASPCFFDGELYEVIVWTNVLFDLNTVANIHSYSTNTYGHSP